MRRGAFGWMVAACVVVVAGCSHGSSGTSADSFCTAVVQLRQLGESATPEKDRAGVATRLEAEIRESAPASMRAAVRQSLTGSMAERVAAEQRITRYLDAHCS